MLGALVVGLIPGGSAERSRILVGDIIRRFDNHEIRSPQDLTRLVATTPVGTPVVIVARRDGREISIAVVVDRRPNDTAFVPDEPVNREQGRTPVTTAAPPQTVGNNVGPKELPSTGLGMLQSVSESAIVNIVDDFAQRYASAPNDMAKGMVRRERSLALCGQVEPVHG